MASAAVCLTVVILSLFAVHPIKNLEFDVSLSKPPLTYSQSKPSIMQSLTQISLIFAGSVIFSLFIPLKLEMLTAN